jgi:type I restriction enzyme S subunit
MSDYDKFFLAEDATDSGYVNVRDITHWGFARDFTESLWPTYRPFADHHFREDAKHHFLQRFWEMYLACTLLYRGFEIKRVGNEGPEFYFQCGKRRIWVEAIAPGPGDGLDRVHKSKLGEVDTVLDEKLILRYTHALIEKYRRYEAALAKGIVQPDDQMLLAINYRGFLNAPCGAEIPYFLKGFLPLGALTVVSDRVTMKIIESYHQRREVVIKQSGANVATTSFLNPKFAMFSAILHSGADCTDHSKELGDDFLILHNPTASYALPSDLFAWCRQFEFKDNVLSEVSKSGKV